MIPLCIDYQELYLSWAKQLEDLKDYSEATRLLKRLVELYPSHGPLFARLSELLVKAENYSDAKFYAERALKLDSQNQQIVLAWLNAVFKAEDITAVKGFITDKLNHYPFWRDLKRAFVKILVEAGNYLEATQICLSLVNDKSEYSDCCLLAYCYSLCGDKQQANNLITKALSDISKGNNVETFSHIIKACCQIGDYNTAIALSQELLKHGVMHEKIFIDLADLFERQGQNREALNILKSGMMYSSTPELRKRAERLSEPSDRYIWTKDLSRRIVFVSTTPKIREAKLAQGLRKLGWEIVLLHSQPVNSDPAKYFDRCIQFINPEEAVFWCRQLDAKLYHVFEAVCSNTAVALIKEKPGIMIFDYIDVFEGMVYHSQAASCAQQYCFENSDALVCRDLQLSASNRMRGKRRKVPVCYFPEYCWDTYDQIPLKDYKDNQIHVVQSGWINVKKSENKEKKSYLDILERFIDNDIHVHQYAHLIIPKDEYESEYGDFIRLGEAKGLTHLHQNVPFDQLIPELSQFDFGLSIVPEVDYPGHFGRYPKGPGHYKYCGSARVTDYLDAGLPVISGELLEFQNFIIRRHGSLIRFDSDLYNNPRKILEPLLNRSTRENILKKRSKYTVAKQTSRLSEFYVRLIVNYASVTT